MRDACNNIADIHIQYSGTISPWFCGHELMAGKGAVRTFPPNSLPVIFHAPCCHYSKGICSCASQTASALQAESIQEFTDRNTTYLLPGFPIVGVGLPGNTANFDFTMSNDALEKISEEDISDAVEISKQRHTLRLPMGGHSTALLSGLSKKRTGSAVVIRMSLSSWLMVERAMLIPEIHIFIALANYLPAHPKLIPEES